MTLPIRLRSAIKSRSIQTHTNQMRLSSGNIMAANNIVRHSVAKYIDEPSPATARSIDKILRTPRNQPRPAGNPIGTPGAAGPSTTI
jgi:hypothetical protein